MILLSRSLRLRPEVRVSMQLGPFSFGSFGSFGFFSFLGFFSFFFFSSLLSFSFSFVSSW
jgi:hypothetical protein